MSNPEARSVAPPIGALLRVAHEQIWKRLMREMRAAGFHDLSKTEYRIFEYPGPEALRPTDLAERCGMTKQSINHVLGSLERKRYLERRHAKSGREREIRLAKRGRKLHSILRKSMRRVERDWAAQVREKRLEEMRWNLIRFAQFLGWRS